MFRVSSVLIACLLLVSAGGAQSVVRISGIGDGWARNQVNAVIFRRDSLTTSGRFQFAAFYDQNGFVNVAVRTHGSRDWKVTRTGFTGNVRDAHNSISIAADGDGFLHIAFDHHNGPLRYARSLKPLATEFGATEPMVGSDENRVTYPEFYRLADGGMIFMYRDGGSGNGRLVINRYDLKARSWKRVQTGLIDGEGRRSAYTQATVDRRGSIHLSWVWRESPDVASNHDHCYAKSDDGGATWKRSDGRSYELPITASNAEIVAKIPQKSELINQTSMTTDEKELPVIAGYWREDGDVAPQIRVVRFDRRIWKIATATERRLSFSLSGGGTKKIPLSRPLVLVRKKGVIVIFRDEERVNRVSATVSRDFSRWRTIDLGDKDVGMWEPTFDASLWRDKRRLSLFVQRVGQGDGEKLEDLAPQPIEVWDITALEL